MSGQLHELLERAGVEPREGIATVWGHDWTYLGCIGEETWQLAMRVDWPRLLAIEETAREYVEQLERGDVADYEALRAALGEPDKGGRD